MSDPDTSRTERTLTREYNAVFLELDKCGFCDQWVTDRTWLGRPQPLRALFHLVLTDEEWSGTLVYDLVDISPEGALRLRDICKLVGYAWPSAAIERADYNWHKFPIRDLLKHCSGRAAVITMSWDVALTLTYGPIFPLIGSYVRVRPEVNGWRFLTALEERTHARHAQK